MNNINFKGSFINNVYIKKYNKNDYISHQVSFVEINPRNKNDLKALEQIKDNWFGLYEGVIYNSAFNDSMLPENRNRSFYALTKQVDNFEKMDSSKILGIIELGKLNKYNTVNFLQVDPQYLSEKTQKKFWAQSRQNKSHNKKYKGIGSAILEALKKMSDKSIDLYALKGTEDFYQKNGFKLKSLLKPNYFIWKKI